MNRAFVLRVGLAVLSGIAGLAVNSYLTAGGPTLLLGRVVTLPIAILFGPWLGTLAALIGVLPLRTASSAALFAIVPAEALAVGIFAQRGKSPLASLGLHASLATSAIQPVIIRRGPGAPLVKVLTLRRSGRHPALFRTQPRRT